ncbi:MAG: hypothetical protein R8G34_16020 [Paracoccaceae bacterium]|nr:hypothetical protein [Paracoccaceae bacterium]
MVKWFFAVSIFLLVTACGSRGSDPQVRQVVTNTAAGFAIGPIGSACLAQNRRSATQQRCGCIQEVANRTLTSSQQARSTRFFNEPSLLQDVRQSSAPSNVRFWEAWQRFAETSQAVCAKS